MNQQKNKIYILTFLISSVLFILGQFIFKPFFEFLEPTFDRITFRVIEIQRGVRTSILFSSTLFLTPICILFTWRRARITTPPKKTLTILIILIFISAALCIQRLELKAYYTNLLKNDLIYLKDNNPATPSTDPVHFVYYMFGGLCIGCIFSFLFLRKKNKRTELNNNENIF